MSWSDRFGRAADRARAAADSLRSEYRLGRDGATDEELPEPVTLWDRPTFDDLVTLLARRGSTATAAQAGTDTTTGEAGPTSDDDAVDDSSVPSANAAPASADTEANVAAVAGATATATTRTVGTAATARTAAAGATQTVGAPAPVDDDGVGIEQSVAEVSDTLGRVDWRAVSDQLANRGTEVGARVQQLAAGIDWDRMKPAASKIASALIAAAATGQLGRLSGPGVIAVARAVRDDQGVGEAAASAMLSRAPGGAAATAVMRTFLAERSPEASRSAAPSGVGVVEQRLAELRQVVELRGDIE